MRVFILFIMLFAYSNGHMALVNPRPRNSVDRPPNGPDTCGCSNSTGSCDNG